MRVSAVSNSIIIQAIKLNFVSILEAGVCSGGVIKVAAAAWKRKMALGVWALALPGKYHQAYLI